jgi:hypothetical protein
MLGTTFDAETQVEERDVILIKVRSDGVVTSTRENSGFRMESLILYPNPASDRITIHCGLPDVTVTMYSPSGLPMVTKKLGCTSESIDVSSFPAGIYVYTAKRDGKVIGSGKWIKK